MAISDDVLVLGGGLAGATAALAAADRGATVRLLTYKQSTLRQASGLIDLLGYTPGGEGPVENPFERLGRLPRGHPYERVGAEAVRDAVLFFDAITGDAYAGGHTDANALMPTAGGALKPTARYPRSCAAGVASDRREALLVGFETLPGFDAPLAAAHLRAADVPFSVRGVTRRFPGIGRDDATITRYVHVLDRDEAVRTPTGGTVRARAALAASIREELRGEDRVGFPTILGDEHHGAVRRELEERLGVAVFEVPSGPPSLPGIRLEDRLYGALADAGVRVTTGVPAVGYEASEGRIEHVLVDRGGRRVPYRAEGYVLATGGLVGKGIDSSRAGVSEPIFDCHVDQPAERYDWFVDDVYGDQPFARFGLSVDRELRPLAATDEPEFANLRAAGAVLGGADFAAEKSGAGISLATGFVAGSRAAGEVAAR